MSVPVILILEFHLLCPVIAETCSNAKKHAKLQQIKNMQALAKNRIWSPFSRCYHTSSKCFVKLAHLCQSLPCFAFCSSICRWVVTILQLVSSTCFPDRQKNAKLRTVRHQIKTKVRKETMRNKRRIRSFSTLARRISRESLRWTHFASKQCCKKLQELFTKKKISYWLIEHCS